MSDFIILSVYNKQCSENLLTGVNNSKGKGKVCQAVQQHKPQRRFLTSRKQGFKNAYYNIIIKN